MTTPHPAPLTLFASADVFAAAASSAAGVRELIDQAAAAGYRVRETFGWRAGSRNVVGCLSVKSRRGSLLFSLDYDTGSGRTPTSRFRVTSRRGRAHIAALEFVRDDAVNPGARPARKRAPRLDGIRLRLRAGAEPRVRQRTNLTPATA